MYGTRLTNLFFLYLLPPVILLAIALYSYQDTFTYPFYFDDRPNIIHNEFIHDVSDLQAIWSRNPARFITFYSLAINYHFGKLNVFGYHVFNFTVHFINGLILFWLVYLILSSSGLLKNSPLPIHGERDRVGGSDKPLILSILPLPPPFEGEGGRVAFALIVAMLFVSHPIQTEAVTYIWQRTSSIVTLFYFLSMALYMKYAIMANSGQTDNRAKIYFAGSIVCATLAMFTKQNAITLPIAILLLDYCFISGSLKKLKEKAGRLLLFLPVMMIIPILTVFGKNEEINHIGSRATNVLSPLDYLLTQFNVLVDYLKLFVFPVNQNLDYDYPRATSLGDSWFSFLLLLALLGLGLFLFNRNKIASFGIIFFFLTNSVESSFFPLEDLMFEHREYLPSMGLFVAVIALSFQGASLLGRRAIYGVVTASLIAVAALSIASFERNKVWKDEETLWKDVVSKSPGKSRGYQVLASLYASDNQFEKSERWYKKALKTKHGSGEIHLHLGILYDDNGYTDLATKHFQLAIKTDPDSSTTHFALGNIYMRKKLYSKAADHYRVALKLGDGKDVDSFLAYGTALTMSGRINRAVNVYKWILKLAPDNKLAKNNLKALNKHIKMGQ